MKEIKIKTHPNINLTVKVTEQMIKDYRECNEMVNSPDFDERDCSICSWWKICIDYVGMCTYDEMKVLLE